jgi:hypothetical protein
MNGHMIKRAWLKRHWKQLAVHGAVIGAFLLYCFFLAGPLEEWTEGLQDEAGLHDISLPEVSNDVRYSIFCSTSDQYLINIGGWAFMEGKGTEPDKGNAPYDGRVYLVLVSPDTSYIFDTLPTVRPDVEAFFKDSGFNLVNVVNSGFKISIPLKKVKAGEYLVGIYIKSSGGGALQYTDKALMKSNRTAKLILRASNPQNVSLPAESTNIIFSMGEPKEIEANGVALIEIKGWAFIEGQSAKKSMVYLMLKSDSSNYVFDTIPQERPDVTALFATSGLNLDNSGFVARIPSEAIKDSRSIIGLYIKNNNIEAVQYTDQEILKTADNVTLTMKIAQKQEIILPEVTGNIKLNIQYCDYINKEATLSGWAFIEGQSAEKSKVYLVLKSDSSNYVFDTILQKRPDVTALFATSGLNLDNSGFVARIPREAIKDSRSIIGLYIKNNNIEAVQYTDQEILKTADNVTLTMKIAQKQEIILPEVTGNIKLNIQYCDYINKEATLSGWAFIEGQSAEKSKVYLILKSDSSNYVFDTIPQERPDVTALFATSGLNLDNSGFVARIPREAIKDSRSIIGLYIKNNNIEAVQYTDQEILKTADNVTLTMKIAQKQEIILPEVTDNIKLNIEYCDYINKEATLGGWAFIEGQSAEKSKVYLVLKSDSSNYVFDTILQERTDVTALFATSGLNLDNSGFVTRIPAELVKDGIYEIGLLINRIDSRNLHYTDTFLYKSDATVQTINNVSTPQLIALPEETGDIEVNMESIKEVADNSLHIQEISGWAFISGRSAETSKIYLVFKSKNNTYIFDTILQERPGVTALFAKSGLNLDNSGFVARIPAELVKDGIYEIGVLINRIDSRHLHYTDTFLYKSGDTVKTINSISTPQLISLPEETGDIEVNMESIKEVVDNSLHIQEISGWAFISGRSAETGKIYLVFKSEKNTYIFDTVTHLRPDVSSAYAQAGLNLDNPGFIARIPREEIENGTYNVGIYIKKGDVEAMQYTDRAILKTADNVSLNKISQMLPFSRSKIINITEIIKNFVQNFVQMLLSSENVTLIVQ